MGAINWGSTEVQMISGYTGYMWDASSSKIEEYRVIHAVNR